MEPGEKELDLNDIFTEEQREELENKIMFYVEEKMDSIEAKVESLTELVQQAINDKESKNEERLDKVLELQKGEKGEKGDQGEKGVAGSRGPQGAPGKQGEAGAAMTPKRIVDAVNENGGVDYNKLKNTPNLEEWASKIVARAVSAAQSK